MNASSWHIDFIVIALSIAVSNGRPLNSDAIHFPSDDIPVASDSRTKTAMDYITFPFTTTDTSDRKMQNYRDNANAPFTPKDAPVGYDSAPNSTSNSIPTRIPASVQVPNYTRMSGNLITDDANRPMRIPVDPYQPIPLPSGLPMPVPSSQNSSTPSYARAIEAPTTRLKNDTGPIEGDSEGAVSRPSSLSPCGDSLFCERVDHYPTEMVQRAIERERLGIFASVDEVPETIPTFAVESRFGDVADRDVPLCPSEERIIFPRAGVNKNKEWLYILNNANFTQGVRVELCLDDRGKCGMFDGYNHGYTTTCKQQYIYRQLAAITLEGQIKQELFRFPSSCCCHLKFNGYEWEKRNYGLRPGHHRSPENYFLKKSRIFHEIEAERDLRSKP